VSWDTVKGIDKRALAARLGPLEQSDFSGVRRIAIDEFALHRGHRYATLVVDVDTKRVVWVHRGRDAEALTGFFAALAGCGKIEHFDEFTPSSRDRQDHGSCERKSCWLLRP
jgi:transposase